MNTPVSFELAKLLKEKGFIERAEKRYGTKSGILYNDAVINDLEDDVFTAAPTIADVVMWLYEKYNIWISADPEIDTNTWFHTITHGKSITAFGSYSTLTEAYEKGIEHILNEMI